MQLRALLRAQIDIVVVSCSCYAPTPSMAACLVNKFGMRKDVLTYQLAGMGCGSSVVCVDMVKRLLTVGSTLPWTIPQTIPAGSFMPCLASIPTDPGRFTHACPLSIMPWQGSTLPCKRRL